MRCPDSLLRRAVLVCAGALLALGVLLAAPGLAQGGDDETGIDVVQIDGLIDPANAAFLADSIRDAPGRGSEVLIVQLDATGAVDVDVAELVDQITDADIPIAVWIGPSSADARGASGLLALAAPIVGIAPGAGIGPIHPVNFDDVDNPTRRTVLERVTGVQSARGREIESAGDVVDHRLSYRDAEELGVVDAVRPILGDFIVNLDGETVLVHGEPVTLETAEVVGEGADRRRQPSQVVRFHKLDLDQQLAHTLVTPWVAYLLFVVGLALLVFEFYTAGIGIAGFVGAIAIVGASYGFSHLPVANLAVFLMMLGLFGLAIDLQAGGLGPWTVIGSAALIGGSIWLYDGSPRLDTAWWMVLIVAGATIFFMLSGMTAMVRSRFSTPTIGREELVGEMGIAEVDVAPDGIVRIRDALWRARTNRATPVDAGSEVRVVAISGVVLEVEPAEGGARDYRDRARRR
ncbi:MAG: NfeD family protein [Actinomycetota bacterium]